MYCWIQNWVKQKILVNVACILVSVYTAFFQRQALIECMRERNNLNARKLEAQKRSAGPTPFDALGDVVALTLKSLPRRQAYPLWKKISNILADQWVLYISIVCLYIKIIHTTPCLCFRTSSISFTVSWTMLPIVLSSILWLYCSVVKEAPET